MRKGETIEQWHERAKFERELPSRIARLKVILREEIELKTQSKSIHPSDVQPNSGGEKSGMIQ